MSVRTMPAPTTPLNRASNICKGTFPTYSNSSTTYHPTTTTGDDEVVPASQNTVSRALRPLRPKSPPLSEFAEDAMRTAVEDEAFVISESMRMEYEDLERRKANIAKDPEKQAATSPPPKSVHLTTPPPLGQPLRTTNDAEEGEIKEGFRLDDAARDQTRPLDQNEQASQNRIQKLQKQDEQIKKRLGRMLSPQNETDKSGSREECRSDDKTLDPLRWKLELNQQSLPVYEHMLKELREWAKIIEGQIPESDGSLEQSQIDLLAATWGAMHGDAKEQESEDEGSPKKRRKVAD